MYSEIAELYESRQQGLLRMIIRRLTSVEIENIVIGDRIAFQFSELVEQPSIDLKSFSYQRDNFRQLSKHVLVRVPHPPILEVQRLLGEHCPR